MFDEEVSLAKTHEILLQYLSAFLHLSGILAEGIQGQAEPKQYGPNG